MHYIPIKPTGVPIKFIAAWNIKNLFYFISYFMHYTDIDHIVVVKPQYFVEHEKQRADMNEVRLSEQA